MASAPPCPAARELRCPALRPAHRPALQPSTPRPAALPTRPVVPRCTPDVPRCAPDVVSSRDPVRHAHRRAAGSAGGTAGAGGAGGAAGSAGGAGGSAGGAAGAGVAAASGGQQQSLPLLDDPTPQQLREWVIQQGSPGGGGFGFMEAAALGSSKSAAAPGASESAAALGARESADALGASASTATGPASVEALLTFTLDSGASRCFFRDCTTVTPLAAPVPFSLADPIGGPIVARASTVLPCPAVLSGSLSGLHLPTFSTNLLRNAVLQDEWVDTFIPGGQRVVICKCSRTGRHLATFTRQPWSGLYTLTTVSAQVADSGQVAASSRVSASGHPSLPRLHSMHSCLLVPGLLRSLPSLSRSPAPPCLPCVEGRQRAAPHSSKFPPTTAPLQNLHMDVWGLAPVDGTDQECYFLLVVDDYTRYTTVSPLQRKANVKGVLIPWIHATRCQLRKRFCRDLLVLRPHFDRGGEFSSGLLDEFCRDEGIRENFTLPASPQQNGIAERHSGMDHGAQQNGIAERHSGMDHGETSPTLRWTGKVDDASVFRVLGALSLVHDAKVSKLSSRTLRCTFLGFPTDAPPWQFYHPRSCRVFSSQDVTIDESVCFYRLHPHGTAPSGLSHVDPPTLDERVEIFSDSSSPAEGGDPAADDTAATRRSPHLETPSGVPPRPSSPPQQPAAVNSGAGAGGDTGGEGSGGAETEGEGFCGPSGGGAVGDMAGGPRAGQPQQPGLLKTLSPQLIRVWIVRRGSPGGGGYGPAGAGATSPGGTADAGGAGGTAGGAGGAAGAGGTRGAAGAGGAGAASPGGTGGAVGAGGAGANSPGGATGAGGAGATSLGGSAGAGGAGAAGTGGAGAAGTRGAGAAGAGGAGGAAGAGGAGAGGTGGARAAGPEGARTGGAGAARAGGAAGAGGAGGAAGGTGAAGTGGAVAIGVGAARAAGPGGARTRGTGAAGTGGATGAAGTGGAGAGGARGAANTGGAGAGGIGGTGAADGTGTAPCRPLFYQQPQSSLPPPDSALLQRHEPETRASTPVCARRVARPRPPTVPGTHSMAFCPSSVPQRVVLPEPPVSSLLHVPNPKSDLARAASPTVTRLLATSEYVCPPSIGGEPALSSDVLEDRQFELDCLAATLPRFASMLLCPEGDPDALDIPTPRSYAEAIAGEYSSHWQTTMDAEMASWRSKGTYVDEVPPPGANIVDGMWIFILKRPPGSPLAFKARYVARGFSQQQGVDFFHNFSPTPKMTTLWVLLHVAAQRDYKLHSLDFSTAFLQGSLHKEIWLRRPPGFIGTTLAAIGFAPSSANPSLFLRTDTSLPPFYVLVYVNDLVFATADTEGLALPTPLSTGHSLSAPPSDESVELTGPYPELVGCLILRDPFAAAAPAVEAPAVAAPAVAAPAVAAPTVAAPFPAATPAVTAPADAALPCTSPCRAASPTEPRRSAEPRRPTEPRCPTKPHCPAATTASTTTHANAATATMASPIVLTFEGRAVDFGMWVDNLQLFLQCDSRDGVSLFDHTSGVSTAPAATADSTVCSQWTTRDAVACLAVRSHLPPAERAHFGQYKTA
ncbi:unnamed protein product [Closterium sp. NIES-54]